MFSARSGSKALMLATAGAMALFGAAVTSVAEATPVAQGVCPINTASVKVSKGSQGSNSATFADIVESGIRFTQGGTRAACIVVAFTAEAYAGAGGTILINAVLDGTTVCEPSGNYFLATVNTPGLVQPSSHAMNFVCTGVSPGSHTIKMQMASAGGCCQVTLYARTVVVHYFK